METERRLLRSVSFSSGRVATVRRVSQCRVGANVRFWLRADSQRQLEACEQPNRATLTPAVRDASFNVDHRKGQISNGVVEGLNNRAKLTMRKSYGFRSPEVLETALLHALGKLPEPKLTHKFW
jgi:hypothetical protein